MQLNSLQLECQRLGADMTLSFGCIVLVGSNEQVDVFSGGCHDQYNKKVEQYFYYIDEDLVFSDRNGVEDMCHNSGIRGICSVDVDNQRADIVDIIGRPIDRGRLCFLSRSRQTIGSMQPRYELEYYFKQNADLYNQTILDRDEKTLTYVRNFLLSIQPPCPQQ